MNWRTLPHRLISAFTLVELLVSTALIGAIMVLLLGTVDQTQRLWQRSRGKVAQFQGARTAFEAMSRRMSQANLNTYWRAQDTNDAPNRADYVFRRHSDFQFISGPAQRIFSESKPLDNLNSPEDQAYPTHAVFFHAPLSLTTEKESSDPNLRKFRGLDSLMGATGYFIEFGNDPDLPKMLADLSPNYPAKYRYRLMELNVPAERFDIHRRPDATNAADKKRVDPRIYDENNSPYLGLVDVDRNPIPSFVRPLWMKEGLFRESVPGKGQTFRFKYANVMAENIVALIVLPKLAERDRIRGKQSTPDPNYLELAPKMQYDSWRITYGADAIDPYSGATINNRTRENLLPPIVQITMVAIDESSAQRMDLNPDKLPRWTDRVFDGSSRIDTVEDFDREFQEMIKSIENDEKFPNVNYRVFTTDVVIRGSKWSRDF